MQIQYLGFQTKAHARDYTYLVIDTGSENREFTFSISNQALIEKRVRYQDAPGICYQKLQRALELETAEQPLPTHSTVSDEDLEDYRAKHSPYKR